MSQRVGRTSDEAVRIVYETPWLALGEFHCEPEDRRWSEENRADEGHFVVFPGTPVRIAQDGHDPVVATPNNVMFYNRHQTYRRALVSARGDHCVFVLLSPQALEEVARAFVPELKDPEIAPFPFSNGPCAAGTYLAHRMLLHHLYIAACPGRTVRRGMPVWTRRRCRDPVARHGAAERGTAEINHQGGPRGDGGGGEARSECEAR
jgi:hypothetical protein